MSEINLDDPEIYPHLDPQHMLGHIRDVPGMIEKAWQAALRLPLPPEYSRVNRLAILGMGGSAIGGDLLAGLVSSESPASISVHRGYNLPAFVDCDTLVIASSYSGTTEETLSAFRQALSRPAKKLVITTGGELLKLAAEHNIPAFIFDYQSPPRAAMPINLMALIGIAQKLDLIADKTADVKEALSVLTEVERELNPSVPKHENPAKQLAHVLHGKLAVIYGAEFLAEVAHRWKGQINENSKAWAFYAALPEINHMDITGFTFPGGFNTEVQVIMLCSPLFHPRILRRYDVTAEMLKLEGIEYMRIEGTGRSPLAQVMGLMLLADYVSYYLALLYGTNPYPILAVDQFKTKMEAPPA
jgi:glucose/mannose-6-phosphate isomerase